MKTVSRFAFTAVAATMPFMAFAAAQDIVTPIANNVLNLVKVLVTIVFVLAVVAFGWGIVKFIFAGGDPSGIAKAKAFLLWGVIGMAVMASLFGLVGFLQTYFGVEAGGLNIVPPQIRNQSGQPLPGI